MALQGRRRVVKGWGTGYRVGSPGARRRLRSKAIAPTFPGLYRPVSGLFRTDELWINAPRAPSGRAVASPMEELAKQAHNTKCGETKAKVRMGRGTSAGHVSCFPLGPPDARRYAQCP